MKYILTTLTLGVLSSLSLTAGTDMKDNKQMMQPSQIGDAGFYAGIYGGANFAQTYGDGHARVGGPGSGSFDISGTNTDQLGAVAGAKFGYRFDSTPICNNFRLQPAVEVEGLYLGDDNKLSYGNDASSRSSIDSGAVFVNGIANLKFNLPIEPYVGLGVGGQYLSATNTTITSPAFGSSSNSKADDFDFALQGLAGINYNFNKHWTIFTEYKFIATIDPSLNFNNVSGGGNYRENPDFIGQHLITAGIKYNF